MDNSKLSNFRNISFLNLMFIFNQIIHTHVCFVLLFSFNKRILEKPQFALILLPPYSGSLEAITVNSLNCFFYFLPYF